MPEPADSVMIFAAGFGTRMGALTRDRPKPLIELAGRPLIDHALEIAAAISPRRTVVNLHYRADMLARHLAGHDVALSVESPDILETGGGLKAALPHLGNGPVFTLNSDAAWAGPNPLLALRAAWDPARMDALLLCIEPGRALAHAGAGDFMAGPDGRARRGPGLVYCGAQIIATDDLAGIGDRAFSLNRVWDLMLERGRLFVLPYSGRWCDVGTPDGLRQAEAMLERDDV